MNLADDLLARTPDNVVDSCRDSPLNGVEVEFEDVQRSVDRHDLVLCRLPSITLDIRILIGNTLGEVGERLDSAHPDPTRGEHPHHHGEDTKAHILRVR